MTTLEILSVLGSWSRKIPWISSALRSDVSHASDVAITQNYLNIISNINPLLLILWPIPVTKLSF